MIYFFAESYETEKASIVVGPIDLILIEHHGRGILSHKALDVGSIL